MASYVLEVKPSHDFCVLEIAGNVKPIERPLALVKPRIGVVTNIGGDHISAFGTMEAIAAEKSKLVAVLPRDGTAVLNADDPRVLAMQSQCRGRVMTYGEAPSAMVRAEHIESRWPERLSFTVIHAGQSYRVHTQLCGVHWVTSVLAALTVALAMDVPLALAVEAVRTVPPFTGRMSPLASADGVTFICDDAKAPLWSIPLSLQFMREARAPRKIVVMGTISDFLGGDPAQKYVAVARQALEVADHVIFVGPNASKCLKAKRHAGSDALHAAPTVVAARRHLERILRAGDLVLLKGSLNDGLGPLADVRVGPPGARSIPDERSRESGRIGPAVRAIVGLGNPGEAYENTPHSVGQRTLELLARSLGVSFEPEDEAMLARVEQSGAICYLVKPLSKVNVSGPILLRLGQRFGFGAGDCILLQDDIDLPIGTVRTRMAGGDGGHRGVRSVLEAFETFAVRRVKVGVGRPSRRADVARHVLAEFEPAERAMIDEACAEAAARALELAGLPRRRSDRGPDSE